METTTYAPGWNEARIQRGSGMLAAKVRAGLVRAYEKARREGDTKTVRQMEARGIREVVRHG